VRENQKREPVGGCGVAATLNGGRPLGGMKGDGDEKLYEGKPKKETCGWMRRSTEETCGWLRRSTEGRSLGRVEGDGDEKLCEGN